MCEKVAAGDAATPAAAGAAAAPAKPTGDDADADRHRQIDKDRQQEGGEQHGGIHVNQTFVGLAILDPAAEGRDGATDAA